MATKTLGVGGDYATFAAAVAGIATWDVLHVITAGTYTEAAAIALGKSVSVVNVSGGQVVVRTPLGSHVGQISGGVTVTWSGDFIHEIRKPGSGGKEYIWLISGSGSKLILDGVTLKSDYTTGNTQAIYQAANNSHEMNDCTLQGTYEALVTLADNCTSSVIDGLTIDGLTAYIVRGNTASAMFGIFDWRDIAGQVTRAPALNAAAGNRIDVTTSGLLTTSRMWGMTATDNMVLGSGTIAIEKSVFDGSKAYAIEAVSGVSSGLTFRDVAFAGFSSCGVRVSGAALSGLIDYCGRSNGCAAFSNSPGSEGAHNVTADPLFTDYAGHDYTIPSNSPYRDVGTACVATVDPIGTVIPQGISPDIGAFEYVSPPVPALVTVDSNLYHATNLTGSVTFPDTYFEIVPQDASGPVTDIKRLLMVWSMMDKRVETVELPADMRDVEWPDNRGWMAEPTAGNRIWLFDRRPLSNQVDTEMQLMLTEDLLWLTRDGIAASYTVTVTHTSRRRDIEIAVKRLDGQTERYGIDDLWNERVV